MPWERETRRTAAFALEMLGASAAVGWLLPAESLLPDPSHRLDTVLGALLDVAEDGPDPVADAAPQPAPGLFTVERRAEGARPGDGARRAPRPAGLEAAPRAAAPPGSFRFPAGGTTPPRPAAPGEPARVVDAGSPPATPLASLEPDRPAADAALPAAMELVPAPATATLPAARTGATEMVRPPAQAGPIEIRGRFAPPVPRAPEPGAPRERARRPAIAGVRAAVPVSGTTAFAPLRVPATAADLAALLELHVVPPGDDVPAFPERAADAPRFPLPVPIEAHAPPVVAEALAPAPARPPEAPGWFFDAADPDPAARALGEELLTDRLLDRIRERMREESIRHYGITGGIL